MLIKLRYNPYFVKNITAIVVLLHVSSCSFAQNANSYDSAKPVAKVVPMPPVVLNNNLYKGLNPAHRKQDALKLADTDGDGITDQFDLEPDTPSGVDVDTRGRALDTDGDGVPDWKDKEKLTQQICFPVDSSGVGICPEHACCKGVIISDPAPLREPIRDCMMNSVIEYENGSITLTKANKVILDTIALFMQANPLCRVIVKGHPTDATMYRPNQLSWDRVYTVINYLTVNRGIVNTHFIFSYDEPGEKPNEVELLTTTEYGPYTIPPPHTAYSKIKNLKYTY